MILLHGGIFEPPPAPDGMPLPSGPDPSAPVGSGSGSGPAGVPGRVGGLAPGAHAAAHQLRPRRRGELRPPEVRGDGGMVAVDGQRVCVCGVCM